jgi:hypothetical protein
MIKFIIYRNCEEILVTTPELEKAMIKEGQRDLDDYDRDEVSDECAVCITPAMPSVRW